MASSVIGSELVSFFIYNPQLGPKEGTVRNNLYPTQMPLKDLVLVQRKDWRSPFMLYHFLPQEHQKILYYKPEGEILNRKIRNIGLCEALVNFTKTFTSDKPCESVHTQRLRQVFYEPEPHMWMVLVRDVMTL